MSNTASNSMSDHWDQISRLKPVLCSHVDVYPQRYRGQRWYVLHNRTSGEHVRLNADAYAFAGRLDGVLNLVEAREQVVASGSEDLSDDDIVELLVRLHDFGALRGLVSANAVQQAALRQKVNLRKFQSRWKNPLAIRIPLFDPDIWLTRISSDKPVRHRHTWTVLWLLLMATLVLLGINYWPALSSEMSRTLRMPQYWVMLWCVYPILKGLHELAHALCLKRFGGEVHEMGFTFLVFMPIPYVDASASWSLRSRAQRMLVSAAGIMAELTFAALALIAWVVLEPGLLRDLAFAVFSIGSVSTLVFNANPLLRFDGYYILQDWLEMPNLHARSRQYLLHLAARHVLRLDAPAKPEMLDNERGWMVGFGLAALVYRNLITAVIALWLAATLMLPGVVLALWLVLRQWCLPVLHFARYLISAPGLTHRRWQTISLVLVFVLGFGALLAFVPMRHQTRVEGVVWVPSQSQVYADAGGVVTGVFVAPGEFVEAGAPLLLLQQPQLVTRVAVLEARVQTQELRLAAEQATGGIEKGSIVDELKAMSAELQELKRQQDSLLVRSPVAGVFTPEIQHRLQGQYFSPGEFIAHLIEPTELLVHVVIPEQRIGPVRSGVIGAEVRLAESFQTPVSAQLVHETPSADHRLPTAALGVSGGGGIPIATTGDGKESLEKVFHLELALPPATDVAGLGERAYVSLQHPAKPLGARLLTATRQLFLKHLPGNAV